MNRSGKGNEEKSSRKERSQHVLQSPNRSAHSIKGSSGDRYKGSGLVLRGVFRGSRGVQMVVLGWVDAQRVTKTDLSCFNKTLILTRT